MLLAFDDEFPSHEWARYVVERPGDIVIGIKPFARDGQDETFCDRKERHEEEGDSVKG